jgi:Undecaprenyl-phosphate glucose phosphotransferase
MAATLGKQSMICATDGSETRMPAPPVIARPGARSARLYRSSVARALEVVDVMAILFVVALALRVWSADRLLAASLAIALPMVLGAMTLWWTVRENDLYRFGSNPSPVQHALRTVGAAVLAVPLAGLAGSMVAYIAGRPVLEGLMEAALVTVFAGLVCVVTHAVGAAIVRALEPTGAFSLNVVIVGATDTARALIEDEVGRSDLRILGIFDDRHVRVGPQFAGVPVLGDLDALMAWDQLPGIDRVIITIQASARSRVKQVVDKLRTMPNKVVLTLDMRGFDSDGTTIGQIGSMPVAYVSGTPTDARRAFWKRVQDLGIGTLALVLLSPVMLLVALAVRLDSPGPVFFRQVRHGFNNQAFRCWKFRSMRTDMTDLTAAQQVMKDDPRVTRVGRFIRKTSLDELPQLFNVLAGDMSLVGPRPHAIGMKTGEVASDKLVADYAHRHRIKPGMTGWAAIHGSRGPVDTPEQVEARVRYDVEYIDTASFWLDIWIMAMTIPSLLGDRQAVR